MAWFDDQLTSPGVTGEYNILPVGQPAQGGAITPPQNTFPYPVPIPDGSGGTIVWPANTPIPTSILQKHYGAQAVDQHFGPQTPQAGAQPGAPRGTGNIQQDITAYINSHRSDQDVSGLYNHLKSLGYNVQQPTHAGGTQISQDKIVLPDGSVMDYAVNVGSGGGLTPNGSHHGYWVNGQPSSTPGVYTPPSSGGGMNFGSLGGGWGTGGFGSGVFNFPQFTQAPPTVTPFQNPVSPMPAFSSNVPHAQPFQNPVGNFGNFTSPVGQFGSFNPTTGKVGDMAPIADFGSFETGPLFNGLTEEQFQGSPGFGFALDRAQKAIERSAASRGTLLTGGTVDRLQENAIGMANQDYGNEWNRAYTQHSGNFGQRLAGYGANQSTHGMNAQNKLAVQEANRLANAQNFGNELGAYNANLNAHNSNFGNALAGYGANQGTHAMNFGNALSGYNANLNALGQNFGQDLAGYNANLAGNAQNFQLPFSTWQANNAANQQAWLNALNAYGTNYNTALGTHTTNMGDLFNMAAYGFR